MTEAPQTPFYTLTTTELEQLVEAGVKWYGGVELPDLEQVEPKLKPVRVRYDLNPTGPITPGKVVNEVEARRMRIAKLDDWRQITVNKLRSGWLELIPSHKQK